MDTHSGLVQCFSTSLKKICLTLCSVIILLISGCATTKDMEAGRNSDKTIIEEQWGVKVESIRTTAAGNLLDFRYRIIDSNKALPLVERKNKPYLIDQESGKSLGVPTGAKVGPLRQTVRYGLPKEDRVYFVLFGNPGGFVKPGKKVTVVIGNFRVEDLVVE
jgi:hypothetical protein